VGLDLALGNDARSRKNRSRLACRSPAGCSQAAWGASSRPSPYTPFAHNDQKDGEQRKKHHEGVVVFHDDTFMRTSQTSEAALID